MPNVNIPETTVALLIHENGDVACKMLGHTEIGQSAAPNEVMAALLLGLLNKLETDEVFRTQVTEEILGVPGEEKDLEGILTAAGADPSEEEK